MATLRTTPRDSELKKAAQHRRRKIVIAVMAPLGALLLIGAVLFRSYEIEGPAMVPTLTQGDRILVSVLSEVEVGDVVVLEATDGVEVVKRVVGVGGDTIAVERDLLVRNGEAVDVTPLDVPEDAPDPLLGCYEWTLPGGTTYRVSRALDSSSTRHPPVTVPEGHVYVLGDHLDRSNDSRFFGTVPRERIVGVVAYRYWHPEPHFCEPPE